MLPSREVLVDTPLHLLRYSMTSRVETPEEERLLQEIIQQKELRIPIKREIDRSDVPFLIETPKQEQEIQQVLDDRKEIMRGTLVRIGANGQEEPVLQPEQPQIIPEDPDKELEANKTKTAFCQFCDSKGVRHKLNCTRPNKEKKV